MPDGNNKILLGQFTTDGVLSGYINLAGLDASGNAWDETNIPIPQISTPGCTDPTACNYDASANQDDGSCVLPDGCTDPLYLEYDASALCDDGSCATLIVNGCTDPTACNYDASANQDDGSCILPDGCTDPLYFCLLYTSPSPRDS